MADRSLVVRIIGDSRSLERAFSRSARSAQTFNAQITGAGKSLTRGLGAGAAVGGVASIGFALRNTTKAALDFESSFAGVRKTVDATEPQLLALAAGFRELATQIPVSVDELNRIGEAAGQLGVRQDAILGFTRTVADLGATTNLAADEAASALARIANITQLPQDQFDRLGSTIADLGNKMAATESEIVDFGLRLAGAGHQVGLTEAQILGFAGALASVGLNAEAGGSAFSRVFASLALNVASGGDKLELFAKIAGQTSEDFKTQFGRDAAGAILAFTEGLGDLSRDGGNVFGVLQKLGLGEVRVRDALLRAAGAGDLFRDALNTASSAWERNIALSTEAAKRYGTTESQLTILSNRLHDLQITVGEALASGLLQVAQQTERAFQLISDWVEENEEPLERIWRRAAAAATVLAKVLGPVLGVALKIILTSWSLQIRAVDKLIGVYVVLKNVIVSTVGGILSALDAFLGGLSSLTDAASHIPGIGDQFKGISDEINASREGLRSFKADLEALNGQRVNVEVVVKGALPEAGSHLRPDSPAPGIVPKVPVEPKPPKGATVEQRNAWFDAMIGRRIDRVQDLGALRDQIAALKKIAAAIAARIAITKDITRKLNLEDKLRDVQRQAKGLGEQLADAAKQQAEDLKDKAKDAADKLKDAAEEAARIMEDAKNSVRDAIGSVFEGPILDSRQAQFAAEFGALPDARQFAANLKAQLDQFKKFQAALATIKKRGGSEQLVSELQAGGVAKLGLVRSIAAADKGTFAQITGTFRQREATVAQTARMDVRARSVQVQAQVVTVTGPPPPSKEVIGNKFGRTANSGRRG